MIKELSVLIVEDDDVAAESITRSLKKVASDINIVYAEHGRTAIEILESKHPDKALSSPFVVLLDLNMPVMNGFEFLEYVRDDPSLQNTVIFILTTSNDDNDRSRAYSNNVAGYMVKSAVGPQFAKLAILMEAYRNAVEPNH
ncbi:two-component system response regulator [Marinomonas sp. CT5]|uniref:response regulator n=1 Tax=Marinomonas sp. CT5 TaxID=2066133 RepID=UPI001BAEE0BD|nr:response regulator [Marinomonas sp. CT5]QUX96297.1 two-component system response regulator [Marinomonas sp. CT5]